MTFHERLILIEKNIKNTRAAGLIIKDLKRTNKLIFQPITAALLNSFRFLTSRLRCKNKLEAETFSIIENCSFINNNYLKKVWTMRIGHISAEIYDNMCYGMLNRKLFHKFDCHKFNKLIKFIGAYVIIKETGRFEADELRGVFRFSALEIKKFKYMAAFFQKDLNAFELEFIKCVAGLVFGKNKPDLYTVAVISNIIYNSYNRVKTEFWCAKRRQIPA